MRVLWALVAAACLSQPATDTLVTLRSRGARLAARIGLPAGGRAPHPAVVLVHGSGEITGRDLMDGPGRRLIDMGFVVLAYDKRGVGQSTGDYEMIGPSNSPRMFDLLAADALVGVEALRRRSDVDPARIGLLGFSQAGWIAPLAASRSRDVAFFVTVSGPAVSVGEEIAYSRLAGEDPGSEQGVADAEIERRMREFKGPFGYDPVPVLKTLATPSLWILGGNDRSIPVTKTRETLEQCRRELGKPITTHVIPGVNHRLMDTTGRQTDFWRPIADWLHAQGVLR
jgi:dienelactone hydrolase